ncbi:unnamed protein product [Coregonus sp. 'balchen']|nr:unnamed protein product [Coregonus sp. 'balchen']
MASSPFKLRLILEEGGIKRMILPERPASVDQLIILLRTQFDIPYTIDIQFQNSQSDSQFCKLTCIDDLPNRGTIKLLILEDAMASSGVSLSNPHLSTSQHPGQPSDNFEAQTFSHDLELVLTRNQRQQILDGVAKAMYERNEYPSECDFEDVAEALVHRHKCLADNGSPKGWEGWKNGLKFKVGKYRMKLGRERCPEMKKTHKDLAVINHCMGKTFALRRQEILNSSPEIQTVEMAGTISRNLQRSFFAALDHHTERLLALSREVQGQMGSFGLRLSAILKTYDEMQSRNVNVSLTAALHCLPALLCESDSEVFKTCKERESRNPGVLIGPVCIHAIISDDEDAVSLQPHQVSIILEDRVVMHSFQSWPDAFLALFGLVYALHLDYPKPMSGSFLFIQQVFLNIDSKRLT